MDYVVGSVAALISGNVTPNRPKLIRRALTPTKHQPSPNVTPKSELEVDRSIFLSPTLQKKKAIVKKSPKRIFQNNELDTTENDESSSPKADKVKKHLENDLEVDVMGKSNKRSPKKRQESSLDSSASLEMPKTDDSSVSTGNSPKKKKKRNSESNLHNQSDVNPTTDTPEVEQNPTKSPKKKNRRKSVVDTENPEQNISTTKSDDITENTDEVTNNSQNIQKKKKKKRKNKNPETNDVKNKENNSKTIIETQPTNKKKTKKRKNKNQQENQEANENKHLVTETEMTVTETVKKSKKKNKKQSQTETNEIQTTTMEIDNETSETVNPNAITEQDSDSEHDSDDEIHSENEEANKELLESQQNNDNSDESDDEQEAKKQKPLKNKQKSQKDKKKKVDGENTEVKEKEINLEDEVKKTLFVGNVPLSKKTRKEIKKIFRKYGEIKTVRIRFVPVKDARVTPKMAVIKNELHPERSTVNVYVKFADEASVEKALVENNTVLNGHHLRVTRTTTTGAEHDPRLAVFVGNMPFGMEDDHLRAVFEKCGEIESVRIVRDKKTNAGKGFGYVNFTSKDGVELALNLSEEDLTVKNRIMRVKRSTQVLGQNKPGQNRPGQSRPGQNRPGQSRPGQNKPGQNRPGQSRPWQDRTSQNRPGQNRPIQKRPGQNRPWQDKSGQNGPEKDRGEDGAHRRIMNKRKYQESSDGPPNKKPRNITQPSRENKKQRKEFVGITSEKKKKRKFDKGQKQKKILSEILTKK